MLVDVAERVSVFISEIIISAEEPESNEEKPF